MTRVPRPVSGDRLAGLVTGLMETLADVGTALAQDAAGHPAAAACRDHIMRVLVEAHEELTRHTAGPAARRAHGEAVGLVLAAVRAGHDHGAAIRCSTGLPRGSVYSALRRLERSGQLSSYWEMDRPDGQVPRKTYRLTGPGPA